MSIFVSPATGGFYHQPGNADIPKDAVNVTKEKYAELVVGLCAGKQLSWNDEGVPTLADPATPTKNYPVVIANKRFAHEVSGVTVAGFVIETTRDSQALITGTYFSALLDPDYRCNFKTVNGFVEIGAAQILMIAKAVRAHVQACFDRELALLRALEAGLYTDAMLNAGWPDSLSSTTAVTAP
jgi:hypothetical protein